MVEGGGEEVRAEGASFLGGWCFDNLLADVLDGATPTSLRMMSWMDLTVVDRDMVTIRDWRRGLWD